MIDVTPVTQHDPSRAKDCSSQTSRMSHLTTERDIFPAYGALSFEVPMMIGSMSERKQKKKRE